LALRLDQGQLAALLAVPWLVVALPPAVPAARHRIVDWRLLDANLLFDAGRVFLAIGAAGLVVQRAGLQPMGLPHVINLLFAVHYHYAGFGLSTLAGSLASSRGNASPETFAGLAAISAVLLLAVAIVFADWLAPAGAVWMGAAGGAVAGLQLRAALRSSGAAKALLLVSSLCGIGGMTLGAAYGLRGLAPFAWLTIPWMATVHGTINSLGFVLTGLLGWTLARSDRSLS
jgi:YndJ-like protein